ncbi:hypothetical protein MFRU_037g00720 [Monilinia fructicola]|nr:hypothetical protein MFRU_037g00720 [Monilinia fructicola]
MSLAYFMDIPSDRFSIQADGTRYYNFCEDGHYYYLHADGSQFYAYGSWNLRIDTIGCRRWTPEQREFAYEPDEMCSRFIFNREHDLIYSETREKCRDNGAPSLGKLMMESGRRHWQPHLQRLQDQIGQANTPQELQYYCMVKIDIEYQLECLEWKTGAGYEAWLKEERQRLQNMGSYSEYNI